ncbi:MAG: hypothetical protein ICV60_23555, partial [Pyrinomonadaceae bacterium]|nr:hypothetical protein [Pyrinomonadaceae bacterium]
MMQRNRRSSFIGQTLIAVSLLCLSLWTSLTGFAQEPNFRITPSENASGHFNELLHVDALTSQDAWAVGHFDPPGAQLWVRQPLIEHWDG